MNLFVPTLAALCLITLTSCKNIRDDGARTRAEGAAAGAAGGALIGGGAGMLGGKKGAAAGAAAGGAMAGAGLGAAYGGAVARKKEGYVRTEDALDAQLKAAKSRAVAYRSYNQRLGQVIAQKQAQAASLRANRAPAGAAVEKFNLQTSVTGKVAEIDQQARSWQETINAHKATLQQSANDARAGELEGAIMQLSSERRELLDQRARLQAVGEKIRR